MTTGNGLKLHPGIFRLTIRKNFFLKKVVSIETCCSGKLVESPCLEVFKKCADAVLRDRFSGQYRWKVNCYIR